jgi:hypothetical protein
MKSNTDAAGFGSKTVLNTLEEAVRFFCRHLVSLSGWYQPIDAKGKTTGETQFFSYSGFIISFKGVWNFVTAGHVLDELEQNLSDKTIKVSEFVLVDKFGLDSKSSLPIPFDYINAPKLPVYDKKAGLDFGLVILSPIYRGLLRANGIVPVTEEDWKNQPDEFSEKYIMLGLPQQFIKSKIIGSKSDERVIGSVVPAAISLTRLNEDLIDIPKTDYPRFIGKLPDKDYLIEDITGMSGGPIIGFNKTLDRYWIVAIQSSWLSERRITFGCPIPIFAKIVEDLINSAKKDDDQ